MSVETLTLIVPDLPSPEGGTLTENPLRHLKFGPLPKHAVGYSQGNIVFNEGVAIVPADHELLPDLLRRYPQIKVMSAATAEDKAKAWVCDVCDRDFPTKLALRGHRRSHESKRPAPEAEPDTSPAALKADAGATAKE